MHLPIYMINIAKYVTGLAILFFGLSFTGVQVPTIINDTAHVVAKIIDPKQITCMAKNIFYEAGAESTLGQAAVARVVMNRVAHGFGKNPCQVIYQTNMIELTKVKLQNLDCVNLVGYARINPNLVKPILHILKHIKWHMKY